MVLWFYQANSALSADDISRSLATFLSKGGDRPCFGRMTPVRPNDRKLYFWVSEETHKALEAHFGRDKLQSGFSIPGVEWLRLDPRQDLSQRRYQRDISYQQLNKVLEQPDGRNGRPVTGRPNSPTSRVAMPAGYQFYTARVGSPSDVAQALKLAVRQQMPQGEPNFGRFVQLGRTARKDQHCFYMFWVDQPTHEALVASFDVKAGFRLQGVDGVLRLDEKQTDSQDRYEKDPQLRQANAAVTERPVISLHDSRGSPHADRRQRSPQVPDSSSHSRRSSSSSHSTSRSMSSSRSASSSSSSDSGDSNSSDSYSSESSACLQATIIRVFALPLVDKMPSWQYRMILECAKQRHVSRVFVRSEGRLLPVTRDLKKAKCAQLVICFRKPPRGHVWDFGLLHLLFEGSLDTECDSVSAETRKSVRRIQDDVRCMLTA